MTSGLVKHLPARDPALANAQILVDDGFYGPEIELTHLYYSEVVQLALLHKFG